MNVHQIYRNSQIDHVTEQNSVALNTVKFYEFEFRRSDKTVQLSDLGLILCNKKRHEF